MWLYEQKKFWKYCFDPKLQVWCCCKIWKGVFRAHCTQIWGTSKLVFNGHMTGTKVPKFWTDIRHFNCDCMSKRNFKNIVLIQSYMYDVVAKFEKVCLGLIAPNLRYLKAGLWGAHVSFTLSSIWWRRVLILHYGCWQGKKVGTLLW